MEKEEPSAADEKGGLKIFYRGSRLSALGAKLPAADGEQSRQRPGIKKIKDFL
ncbi:MAG TPA: hypothetical protein PLU75_09685 [Oscillospiraceae bacterium]|nr:hypothetical protein [Oscillospiraceae bacterium]HRW57545.1 hypothetical protein [Oscillospiraceae bacterium]